MKIKLIVITVIISLTCFSSFAQKNNFKKIKALKIAFITQSLDLTPKEAEKFWPVFNKYDELKFNLRAIKTHKLNKKIKAVGGIDNFSEIEAKEILNDYLQIEKQLYDAKTTFNEDLKQVLPTKKIIKLFRAEHDFNRKLLQQFRKKINKTTNKEKL